MSKDFVHLHNHSDYSLLDGAQKIKTMVQKFEIFDSIEARKFNLSEDNQKLLYHNFLT